MTMSNPIGRVNYQPNSFGEGPRESPQRGFRSFADGIEGPKSACGLKASPITTIRPRPFFINQMVPEQRHIVMALTFELDKVETRSSAREWFVPIIVGRQLR